MSAGGDDALDNDLADDGGGVSLAEVVERAEPIELAKVLQLIAGRIAASPHMDDRERAGAQWMAGLLSGMLLRGEAL